MASESSPATATMPPPEPGKIAEGLRGITVSESKISFVDGVNGRLLYRGYSIADLAENSSFEETSYLLLHGDLPTKQQLREFTKSIQSQRKIPPALVKVLK